VKTLARFALALAAPLFFATPARADDAAPASAEASSVASGASDAAAPAAAPSDYEPAWCAPELETLPGDVCYAKGPAAGARRTLVIFLHGLTPAGGTSQYALQRGITAFGKRLGYAVLAPRGRTGVGPGRKEDTVAWPTGEAPRRQFEDGMLDAIFQAKTAIEAREGAPFDEVFVMGFSNGAYYASSLALRGRLDVDGYAVFAGGSAPKGTERTARATKNRRPVFVGIASRDDTAKKGRELAKVLDRVRWPHETSSRPVGHVVADAQLERAVAYLRGTVDAKKGGAATAAAAPAGAPAAEVAAPAAKPSKKAAQRKKKPAAKKRRAK
jgi:predicted esterase